jgi:hypothetical protein
MKTKFLITLFTVCTIIAYSQNGPLVGNGKIITREFANTGFDKLSFEDFDGKIEVEIGKKFSISIAIDENIQPLLFVRQQEDEKILRIGLNNNKNGRLYLENTNIKIKVTLPEASIISHRGNTNFFFFLVFWADISDWSTRAMAMYDWQVL